VPVSVASLPFREGGIGSRFPSQHAPLAKAQRIISLLPPLGEHVEHVLLLIKIGSSVFTGVRPL